MKEVLINKKEYHGKKKKPIIITWNGVKMVRDHSIRAVADEITNMSANQDLISVNVIGKQSTGKTELARTLAHLVHQMAQEEYNVLHLGRKELLNLEETVANLKPTNYIIIFDDIAFLKSTANSQQIEKVQAILAEIRHLPGGKDVRIILFKSFQYTKAIPPFLRQNDMTFVSSVDDNEVDSLIALMGKHNQNKIKLLKKLQVQVKLGKANEAYFHYPLGHKEKMYHKYHARHPFLPYLYYNGISARIIVSPLRTWIDPVCDRCDHTKEKEETIKNAQAFKEDFLAKFTDGSAMQALKIILLKRGIDTHRPRIAQAMRFIEQYMSTVKMDPNDLMELFELEETSTKLNAKKKPNLPEGKLPIKEVDDT